MQGVPKPEAILPVLKAVVGNSFCQEIFVLILDNFVTFNHQNCGIQLLPCFTCSGNLSLHPTGFQEILSTPSFLGRLQPARSIYLTCPQIKAAVLQPSPPADLKMRISCTRILRIPRTCVALRSFFLQ